MLHPPSRRFPLSKQNVNFAGNVQLGLYHRMVRAGWFVRGRWPGSSELLSVSRGVWTFVFWKQSLRFEIQASRWTWVVARGYYLILSLSIDDPCPGSYSVSSLPDRCELA